VRAGSILFWKTLAARLASILRLMADRIDAPDADGPPADWVRRVRKGAPQLLKHPGEGGPPVQFARRFWGLFRGGTAPEPDHRSGAIEIVVPHSPEIPAPPQRRPVFRRVGRLWRRRAISTPAVEVPARSPKPEIASPSASPIQSAPANLDPQPSRSARVDESSSPPVTRIFPTPAAPISKPVVIRITGSEQSAPEQVRSVASEKAPAAPQRRHEAGKTTSTHPQGHVRRPSPPAPQFAAFWEVDSLQPEQALASPESPSKDARNRLPARAAQSRPDAFRAFESATAGDQSRPGAFPSFGAATVSERRQQPEFQQAPQRAPSQPDFKLVTRGVDGQPQALPSSAADPWPELPRESDPEPEELAAALGVWERSQRLALEQNGEGPWSV
jgi:hypothetical protein